MAIATRSTLLQGLRCRACGELQPADERYVCAECLGPIEPEYDLDRSRAEDLRAEIMAAPPDAASKQRAAKDVVGKLQKFAVDHPSDHLHHARDDRVRANLGDAVGTMFEFKTVLGELLQQRLTAGPNAGKFAGPRFRYVP